MLVCLALHFRILLLLTERQTQETDNEWMRKWMSGNNNWKTALINVLMLLLLEPKISGTRKWNENDVQHNQLQFQQMTSVGGCACSCVIWTGRIYKKWWKSSRENLLSYDFGNEILQILDYSNICQWLERTHTHKLAWEHQIIISFK